MENQSDNLKACPPKFCETKLRRAWVITVDMGYGHQRTAYPLKDFAEGGKIINANSYEGIPERDKKIWETSKKFYEFISSFKRVPVAGNAAFAIFNEFQKILKFYPKRNLSRPNLQLRQAFYSIKGGWGQDLIERLRKKPIPLLATFFTPAFMAEFFNYPGEIFCTICDADISRAWAPLQPQISRIRYFAPTSRVVERLRLYGIRPENIFLTGYPLPQDIIGTEKLEILKEDLPHRILNLDPKKKYFQQYGTLVKKYIGDLPKVSNHPLTLMFAVGGAGAQKEIGAKILKNLNFKIKDGKIKVILVAGIREKVREYFIENIKTFGLSDFLGSRIEIIFEKNMDSYFKIFNQALRKADILWTKPSELSFYSALGLPIIIAPTIGYQEEFNKDWLLKLGSGILQENPRYGDQWLFDWLDSGLFAEAAMQGFVEGEKLGTLNIKKIISKCSG